MLQFFIVAWILLIVITATLDWIRQENMFAVSIIGLVAVAVIILVVKERMRRKLEGFSVRTKGNADGGDIIYEEDGKLLTFYFDRPRRTIYIPSDVSWTEKMPDWANARKGEIVLRMRKRMGRNWTFADKED